MDKLVRSMLLVRINIGLLEPLCVCAKRSGRLVACGTWLRACGKEQAVADVVGVDGDYVDRTVLEFYVARFCRG